MYICTSNMSEIRSDSKQSNNSEEHKIQSKRGQQKDANKQGYSGSPRSNMK